MPSVNDIVTVAEAFERCDVAVAPDSCVAVRNRNASCRRCVEACPFSAISVGGNDVRLEPSKCVACGACVAVCPTEALLAQNPTDSELCDAIASSTRFCDEELAVIACARISSKRDADAASYAELPCLARVEESLLLQAALNAARGVVVVDGDCSTCKYRACTVSLDAAIASANEILQLMGSEVEVKRMTGFPDDLVSDDAAATHGTTRRAFFSEAVASAKDTAMTAARATIENELHLSAEPQSLGERLRVTESGTLPLVRVVRHEAILNAMDEIGSPASGASLDSRLFASVSVDAAKCNGCAMCSMFCPTGALKRDRAAKGLEPLRYLEFSACDCVQCGLCVDVCWKGAVVMKSEVSLDELFDFEPRTFDLA